MSTGWQGRFTSMIAGLCIAGLASTASAIDEWDAATVKDNTAATTRNLLQRGVNQIHDLQAVGGVADEDWFVLGLQAYRQHQIYVTEVTGDTPVDNVDFLELWDATGTTLLQQATIGLAGVEKLIRFFSGPDTAFRIRVKGNANSPATSRYSISLTESTMYCPRYNNAGTQVSVLIAQNTTNGSCGIGVEFFDEAGTFITSHQGSFNGSGMLVLSVGSIPMLAGTKGSVRLQPYCSPSGVKAKMVALEPATGFSFDTLCERR